MCIAAARAVLHPYSPTLSYWNSKLTHFGNFLTRPRNAAALVAILAYNVAAVTGPGKHRAAASMAWRLPVMQYKYICKADAICHSHGIFMLRASASMMLATVHAKR